MLVKQAKEIARQWVEAEATRLPGFYGAFFHGSINELPDEAALAPTSDVDVMVVLDVPELPAKPGKLPDLGVLLEASYLGRDQLRSPEQVLGVSHLAGSFRRPSIILDPSGDLTRLQAAVSAQFARRYWVERRCLHAQEKALAALRGLEEPGSLPEQAIRWLFGTGLTTHVLLVAGLRNPTVRKRYLAARRLLEAYGRLDFYPALLELLGCADLTPDRARLHLDRLTAAFDAAAGVLHSPFYFAADLSPQARSVAIGGSRELIEGGNQREAVFWLAVTYARSLIALAGDGPPDAYEQHLIGFWSLLGDLGIRSTADFQSRGLRVKAFLPRLWQEAQAIIAANPEIGV